MCGICGGVLFSNQISLQSLMRNKIKSLDHRGPDANGVVEYENIFLGHTRLKVIDLSEKAAQPMFTKDNNLVLSYNGEIFNFQELKTRLKNKGYIFFSDSDTEVILNSYKEWGVECLNKFNGMFALAILDKRKKSIIIARDRFGIKPLYFVSNEKYFLFSSEIKSFINTPGFSCKLNQNKLAELFAFRTLLGEDTLIEGIHMLEPGSYINIDIGSGKKYQKKYWELTVEEEKLDYSSARENIRTLLKDSLELRKISDVPLGLLLSGGVDSSLLAALNNEINKDRLLTFSVGFSENEFDERPYCDFVSDKFNTDHKEYIYGSNEVAESFEKSIWHLEEPINHPHTPLLYLISSEIKKHVSVIISGEASDEIFAGYTRHLTTYNSSFESGDVDGQIFNSSRLIQDDSLKQIFKDRNVYSSINKRFEFVKNEIPENLTKLQKLQFHDLKTYLPSLLVRLDKMTMAASIESRVPFMDYRLVEKAFNLPDEYKIKNNIGKYILKDIAGEFFPKEFVNRKKVGFRTPFRDWFRKESFFKKIIQEESQVDEFLNNDYLNEMSQRFFAGDDSFECSDLVWSVVNLKVWSRLFLS